MIFGPARLDDVEGAVLAHGQKVGDARWEKGRRLTATDIATARASGLTALVVARLEPDDVGEDEAARRLGTVLAGANITAAAPAHGRVNLIADAAGLVMLDRAMVDAINAIDEAITLATLTPFARVTNGDIVATIKIIPYAVEEAALDLALAAAGMPIALAPFQPTRIDLIQTRLPGTSEKLLAKTTQVMRARLARMDGTLEDKGICLHGIDALAALLAQPTDAVITLVAGASATVDRRDVVPAAIVRAGGRVERVGMPVDPGNLLCLGRIGERIILGLPGCARSPKRNGVDLVLERLVARLDVDAGAIGAMGVGGLLLDTADRPEPRITAPQAIGSVGAVLLAAGRSSRMGDTNKLLADLGGRPVIGHVLDTIAAAGLPMPIIVLGHSAQAVRTAIGGRPAQIVLAPDYAQGLSQSLRAGIAAVPKDWRAVLICLGDMPQVRAATLATLAGKAQGPDDIILPTFKGKRGNPVLWGRSYFPRLATLTGDIGGKALLAEVAERIVEVPVDDPGILTDIDTPEALAKARNDTAS